jgi:FKBP-type peptidyl-prolyl cis-trans isomerase FkpA
MPKLSLREQRRIAAEERRRRQRLIMAIIAILIVVAVVLIIFRSIQVSSQAQASTEATETSVAAITPVASPTSTDVQFPGLISDTVKTTSGLQYKDIVVGNGDTAQAGKTVSVQYTGWLTDGTKFDSSLSSGKAFEFTLGKGSVIKGWDEGVAGMKVGSTRILIIPPDLAYGSSGTSSIPANSTLVFQVQLLAIK